jgi:hypothetical protein
MKTPAGTDCIHFYGDYYRGRNVEECRLIKAQGGNWTSDLCASCPVPGILRANSCEHLKLKAGIHRPITALFQRRVQITAYCQKTHTEVAEPHIGCGECHALPFKFEIKE